MPKKAAPAAPAVPRAAAAVDRNRRTCLVLDVEADPRPFIQLSVEDGLQVERLPVRQFNQRWTPLPDYPPERAARLYVGYSRTIGATQEALDALGLLTTVTQEDITMATAKKTTAVRNEKDAHQASLKTGTSVKDLPAHAKAPAKKGAAAKPTAKPAVAKKAAAPAKGTATAKPTTKKPAAPRAEGKRSAADAFREHIRAGKLTDDAIFAAVQKEFGLDDKKRGYVSWYRNDLRKKGEKVPDAKA